MKAQVRPLLLSLLLAGTIAMPAPASAGTIPTLEQYLTWCLANEKACHADLYRYVQTAVDSTAADGGSTYCATQWREHWADYMLNYLRTEKRRANEPAPDVFHDAVKAIFTCIH